MIYFDSSSTARTDVNDPGVNGLEVDASHSDCPNNFESAAGERVSIEIVTQGQASALIPIRSLFGPQQRWVGESLYNLPIYRKSRLYLTVRFAQSLGNVDLALLPGTLSSSAHASLNVASNG